MKFILTPVLIGMLFGTAALAADPSEEGVPTSPLHVYSGGLTAGAFYSLTDELRNNSSEQHLKLAFSNSVYISPYMNFFLDVDWFIPLNNYGADMGLDLSMPSSKVKPFLGFGVGAHHFDKDNEFGMDFGPSLTAHVGFLFDLTEQLMIRVRVPYHLVLNDARDQSVGLDFSFLFASRFRNVKKLNY